MRKRVNILDVCFDKVTMKEAVDTVIRYIDENEKHTILTANPEIVMKAHHDKEFCKLMNQGDLVVADGIGIIIASKIIKKYLPERVAGYDLIQNIFKKIMTMDKTVYLFGAAPKVAEKAAELMMIKYPGLKIIGSHDGYFDNEEEKLIIKEINELKPDLLLVGLGAPKQEDWWFSHKDELNVKVCIGVGGSFDVMSGKFKRAPKIFIRFGLEWFHRLITQPTRFKRMIKLPLFLLEVLKTKKQYMKEGMY